MPDIAMCLNESCSSRRQCYRFMAIPSDRQCYSTFDVPEGWRLCDAFLQVLPTDRLVHGSDLYKENEQ